LVTSILDESFIFHAVKINPESGRVLWGVYPISRVTTPMPAEFPVKAPSFSGFVYLR
jgi:hypothetical protein